MGDKCGAHSHLPDEPDPAGPVAWSDGKRYWRSLDELKGTPQFWDKVHREFPRYASQWTDDLSRRNFLKVMGASLALVGSAGCFKKPEQEIVPYVQQPQLITPGVSLHFATALPMFGCARGVVVRSDEGRPTKIEGNPKHPASLGASDAMTQAMLLDLYDPDRSQSVINDGQVSSWDNFLTDPQNGCAAKLDAIRAANGKGLVIVTEPILSPALGSVLSNLFKSLPDAKWYRYETITRANARDGAEAAFGKDHREIRPVYHFDQAQVVLSLDSDFLSDDPGSLTYARQFIDGRRVRDERRQMNRFYAMEGTHTITGAMADHRLAIKPSRIEAVTRAIAVAIGLTDAAGGGALSRSETAFAKTVAAELTANGGASLVIPSISQPAAVHALAHAINDHLGNVGKTVAYVDGLEVLAAAPNESLADLAASMDKGEVEMLVLFEVNPVYAKPADVDFAKSLQAFSSATGPDGKPRYFSVRLGLFEDETSLLCQWHLPSTHPLEAWTDLRAYDGTLTICQPLIYPLYNGRSTLEFTNWLNSRLITQPPDGPVNTGLQDSGALVKAMWQAQVWQNFTDQTDFDIFWETCLHDGVVPKSALPQINQLTVAAGAVAPGQAVSDDSSTQIIFRPDPCIWDGRFANNGWMQELPKPMTKVTWDNAVLMSIGTAAKLGVTSDDLVRLTIGNLSLATDQTAVWILPGHAEDCVTVHLGYGRTRAGRVGDGMGFNAYALRTSAAPFFAGGLKIEKVDGAYRLASTQGSQAMEGRDLIKIGNVDFAYKSVEEEDKEEADAQAKQGPDAEFSGPDEAKPIRHPLPLISMHPETPDHEGGKAVDPQWQAWGMVIDNNACIGCSACVVACQAENNISVVGKDQVARGREMHWLRIDTYFQGAFDANGVPENQAPDAAYTAATNRGSLPGGQGLGAGNAGSGADASNVHAYFEPVPCMQCEKAPCELVCPVGATLHDVEGINDMIYNRCVGTRYCSNNCPYKVRRFNFLLYADLETKSLALGRNPDVTVRTRGVMEKCNYCIQRINNARIDAKKANQFDDAGKPIINDGTVQTACQQACPTQAIIFGDISDSDSKVRKAKEEPLNYVLLEELQTKPRTSYLWRLTNPNPDLAKV
jgi:molybdopterin-containing oxidoreductase family iron-sulfur binding subunit